MQIMGAIQPVTRWMADDRANIVSCTPMDANYSPIRLHAMPISLYLSHPDCPTKVTKYLIRPPRLHSDLQGDTYWATWWYSIILVKSTTHMPLPFVL